MRCNTMYSRYVLILKINKERDILLKFPSKIITITHYILYLLAEMFLKQ